MSLAGSTLSSRRLGFAAAAAGFVAVVVVAFATSPLTRAAGAPAPGPAAPATTNLAQVAAPAPAPPPAPATTAAIPAEPPAGPDAGDTHDHADDHDATGGAPVGDGTATSDSGPATGSVDPAEVARAKQVAADFATEYVSYRFDEPADAMVGRVRPYVTDDFAAQLARSSGASAAREELAERQEVATGSVQAVHTDTVSPEVLRLLVVARQEVTAQTGDETRYPTLLLRLAPTPDGWRVDAVES